MTDKTPAMPELPEPSGVIVVGTQALRAFTADQMRAYALAALQSAQPAAAVSDDLLDRMDMEAKAEANQNPHGTPYHWRKAYLRAFARAILALRPDSEARRVAQEQLYTERERHTAEVKRLQAEIGRLQALRPQADYTDADAWLKATARTIEAGCKPEQLNLLRIGFNAGAALRPQAVPMTDEQRQQAFNNSWATSADFFAGIVAAEAHHFGITAQGAQGEQA